MSLYPLSPACPTCGAPSGALCQSAGQRPSPIPCPERWEVFSKENTHSPRPSKVPTFASPFPTADAYMRTARALNWRNAQLRSCGVEPDAIPENADQYPPMSYVFQNAPFDRHGPTAQHATARGVEYPAVYRIEMPDMSPIVAKELERIFNELPNGVLVKKLEQSAGALATVKKALGDAVPDLHISPALHGVLLGIIEKGLADG